MKRFAIFLAFFCISVPIYVQAQVKLKIAVIPLSADDVSAEGVRFFTELFETGLINTKYFQVIEQNRVKEIVESQKLSLVECSDEDCAIELGRLISSDWIVLGAYSPEEGIYVINVKIIDVTKGETIYADEVIADSVDKMTDKVELLASKLPELTSEAQVAHIKERMRQKIESLVQQVTTTRQIRNADIEAISLLTTQISDSINDFPELEKMIEELLQSAPAAAISQFQERVDEAERILDPAHTVTETDITAISVLVNDLDSSDFFFPDFKARADDIFVLATTKLEERRLTLQELQTEQAALQAMIDKSRRTRKITTVGGVVSLAVGIVGGGISGLFLYLADDSYTKYLNATVTADAVKYKQQFQMWDTGFYIAAGTGALSLGISAVLWIARPAKDEYQDEMISLTERIAELEGELQ